MLQSSSVTIASSSTPVCSNCKSKFINIESLFCPYCGTPCLQNSFIRERTTGNFDPMNPLAKPWREPAPRIPLPAVSVRGVFRNKNAWKPAMKQGPKRLKPKIVYLPSATDVVAPSERMDDKQDSECTIVDATNPIDILPAVDTIATRTDEFVDKILPIVIYPVDLLKNCAGLQDYLTTVHISLLERKRRALPSPTAFKKTQYWLRIGAVIEPSDRAAGSEGEFSQTRSGKYHPIVENPGELINLEFLSNEIGRALKGNSKEWIDLCSIDPHEYYMTEFLRGVLQSLAHRVFLVPGNFVHSFDQWMFMSLHQVVSEEYEVHSHRSSQEALTTEILGTWFKFPPHTSYAAAMKALLNQEELPEAHVAASSVRGGIRRAIELGFDGTICQIVSRIVVSNLPIEMSILTMVRMSVIYGSTSPLPYPLPDSLNESISASQVVLHLYPMYSKECIGIDLAPKIIVLDALYVDFMLRGAKRTEIITHHRRLSSTSSRLDSMGQVRELRGDIEYNLSGSIDLAIEVGGKFLETILKAIVSCLKYESTKCGVSVLFAGSVNKVYPSEYAVRCDYSCEVIPWPDKSSIEIYAAKFAKSQAEIDAMYYFDDMLDDETDVKDTNDQTIETEVGDDEIYSDEQLQTQPIAAKSRYWKHKEIDTGALAGVQKSDSSADRAASTELEDDPISATHVMRHVPLSKELRALVGLVTAEEVHSHTENQTRGIIHSQGQRLTVPVNYTTPNIEDSNDLSMCRYLRGCLISFQGKFSPLGLSESKEDENEIQIFSQAELVVFAAVQGADYFPTSSITIGPDQIQFLFSSLEPPYEFEFEGVMDRHRSSLGMSAEEEFLAELQRVWTCILEDDCLQQRLFSLACDNIDVQVSREQRRITMIHHFDESLLC